MKFLTCFFLLFALSGCGDIFESWVQSTKGDKAKAYGLYERIVQHDHGALQELQLMVDSGDPFASFYAGLARDPGSSVVALGGDEDPAEAARLYQKAMSAVPAARHNLALLILGGEALSGADLNKTLLAASYLQESARSGKLESMLLLGFLYSQDWDGHPKNIALASKWYEEAVLFSKDPRAEFWLGITYLDGMGGVDEKQKGFRYLLSAAKSGIAAAQYEIGRRSKDPLQSAQWLTIAAMNDKENRLYSATAQQALDLLSAQDRSSAQKAAQLWVHVHFRKVSLPDFTRPIEVL